MEHCRKLKFTDMPDYDYLVELLQRAYEGSPKLKKKSSYDPRMVKSENMFRLDVPVTPAYEEPVFKKLRSYNLDMEGASDVVN